MTLFKKVFSNHAAVGRQDAPSPTSETAYDDIELPPLGLDDDELVFTDANMDQGPSQEDDTTFLAKTASKLESPENDARTQVEITSEMTMAERAALAQKQMQMSQAQLAAGHAPTPASTPSTQVEREVAQRTLEPDGETEVAPPAASTPPTPKPASGGGMQRPARPAGRVRTRLLGFDQGNDANTDPFSKTTAEPAAPAKTFPTGWFVVVAGPGTGHSFAIFTGASMIGRGEDQAIKLDFGDTSISRQGHAAVAYDDEQNKFYLGHGGKSNIIRLNDCPVLSTEELSHADLIRIGETTLRFVALCGPDFKWDTSRHDDH